ncbi:hypothetical protein IL992_09560 [Microbispora sp. NEAU-D428]|uniref:TetR/AcrR family transcriptional regulator n=1 Tax=Microbispora sitophila TaxID=2771537 RepID=UPI001868168B|nr:hypothetical protein [Microbispora sitophila]MBE3009443.1 hypothetical protein [Microbispora sitophila]
MRPRGGHARARGRSADHRGRRLQALITPAPRRRGPWGSSTRYRAQLVEAIPAADAGVRASVISAVLIGVVLGRHLLKLEELRDAPPEQISALLRPCLRSLTGADG